MRRSPALAFAVASSALWRACLAGRVPVGGVVLAPSPGDDPALDWAERRGASSLLALGGRGAAAGGWAGAHEDFELEHIAGAAGGAFAVLLILAVSCYFSGSFLRLRYEARRWHVAATPAGAVHLLHLGDEDCLRTAASVAATLRGLGCTVTGVGGSEEGAAEPAGVAALCTEADLVLCVLTPTIFALDAARAELARAKGLGIPVIPVHAGDQFPRDSLTPMISCSPSELVAREFPQGDEEVDVIHELRRYVFRENIRDVDNVYHAKACAATVGLLAQRAGEARAQRIQEVPNDHYTHDVFISYHSRDGWEVYESVAAVFEGLGLEVFNPSKDLQRTEVSVVEMIRHVKGSRFLIQVNTPHYTSSKWCRAELLAAEDASIPIHSVFAGKKNTGKQLLDLLNTPAKPGSKDQEGINKARTCILEAIGHRGMVDAYNPDFAKEAASDLEAIAYEHIARLRWTKRLKFLGIALTICLLVALAFVCAAVVVVADMEKDCADDDLPALESKVRWLNNTVVRTLDPGCFKTANTCVLRLRVAKEFGDLAKRGDYKKIRYIYQVVKQNIKDGPIVFEGLLTVSQLAHAHMSALEKFTPDLVRTAIKNHSNHTWLLMQANTLLLQFTRLRFLPAVCTFVRALLVVLEHHHDDVRLQQRTLQVVRVITGQFTEGSNTVQQCAPEAFNACLTAMEKYSRVEGVQDHGSVCLRNLARWVAEGLGGPLKQGADLAIKAMQVHDGNPVVLASAAQALLKFSNRSEAVRGWLAANESLVRVLLKAANSTSGRESQEHTSRLLNLLSLSAASAGLPGMDDQGVQVVVRASLRLRDTDARAADNFIAVLRKLVTRPSYRPMLLKHEAMSAATAAISARAEEATVRDALKIIRELANYSFHEEKKPELVLKVLAQVSRKASVGWDAWDQTVREDAVDLFVFVAMWPSEFIARGPSNEPYWLDDFLAERMINCLGSGEDGETLQAKIMQLWILLAQDPTNVRFMYELSAAKRLLPVLTSSVWEATVIRALDLLTRMASEHGDALDEMVDNGLLTILNTTMSRYSTVGVQCLGMDLLRAVRGRNHDLRCEDVASVMPRLRGVDPGNFKLLKSEVRLLASMTSNAECIAHVAGGSFQTIMTGMRGMLEDLSLQLDAVMLVTALLKPREVLGNIDAADDWAVLLLAACQAHLTSDDLHQLVAGNLQDFEAHRPEAKMFQRVLPLVLDMVRTHKDSEAVQVFAVRLLDRTAAEKLPDGDTVWLRKSKDCGAVTVEPRWLLAVREQIGAYEAIPLVLHAMDTFPLNMAIQTRASSLLKSLAMRSAEKLVEAGAVRYLLPSHFSVPSDSDRKALRMNNNQTVRFMLSLCTLEILSSQIQLVDALKIAGTSDAMTIERDRNSTLEIFAGRSAENCGSYFSMLHGLTKATKVRTFIVLKGCLKIARRFLELCSLVRTRHRSAFLDMVSSLAADAHMRPLLVRDGLVGTLQGLLPQYHSSMSTKDTCVEDGKRLDKLMLSTLTDLAQAPETRKQMLQEGVFAIAYIVCVVLHPHHVGMLGQAVKLLSLLVGEPGSQAIPDRDLAGAVLRAASDSLVPDTRRQAEKALKLIGQPTEEGVAAALGRNTLFKRFAVIPPPRC